MPLPPPSASYLWKFDDLTDDENDSRCSSDDDSTSPAKASKPATLATDTPPQISLNRKSDDLGRVVSLGGEEQSQTLLSSRPSTEGVSPIATTSRIPIPASRQSSIDTSVRRSSSDEVTPSSTSSSSVLPRVVSNVDEKKTIRQVSPLNETWKGTREAICKSPAVVDGNSISRPTFTTPNEDVVGSIAHDIDTDDDGTAAATADSPDSPSSTISSSRKRKMAKKRKKKKSAATTTAVASAVSAQKSVPVQSRRVSFSNAQVYFFDRCLGVSVVPGDGGWPLGMEATVQLNDKRESEICSIPIDEYEKDKQLRLQQRHATLPTATTTAVPTVPTRKPVSLEKVAVLETRQWDYKRQCRNPLFGSLSETDRMNLLLASSTAQENDRVGTTTASVGSDAPRRKHPHRRVARNLSHNSASSHTSTVSAASGTAATAGNGGEHYNEVFTAMDVRHVRNELEQIRNNRTMEGATGCTCRKLQVYIMPASTNNGNAAAGKKAHHRRMKLSRVKEELRKRQILPPEEDNTPREVLELLLHETVESEPCCSPLGGCSCVRNGIECQADACSCWFASHGHASPQSNGHSTSDATCLPDEIRTRCGNPAAGMYVVDFAKIDAFRSNVLMKMKVCGEAKV
jgi:Cysteine/serine-rich nuclear protein N-terminus